MLGDSVHKTSIAHGDDRTLPADDATATAVRQERLRLLAQLASGIAHQIRNPLGAISNALALLRRQLEGDEREVIRQALAIAEDEVWAADRVITDLLDYARVARPELALVALDDIVSATLATVAMPPGVRVELQLGPHLVYVDAKQTRSALAKIVRNATEAMEGEGTLTISSRLEGVRCVLLITDTGPGVGHVHGDLFEPLCTSKPMGLGLGLTAARALIANQGGTLEVEAPEKPGARFVVYLPTDRAPTKPDDS